jgi:hypothetical protein
VRSRTRFATVAVRSTFVPMEVANSTGSTSRGEVIGASKTIPAKPIAPDLTAAPTMAARRMEGVSEALAAPAPAAAAAVAAAIVSTTSKARVRTRMRAVQGGKEKVLGLASVFS